MASQTCACVALLVGDREGKDLPGTFSEHLSVENVPVHGVRVFRLSKAADDDEDSDDKTVMAPRPVAG